MNKKYFANLSVVACLTSCANIHPVKTVGADTYQITHIMAASAPNAGVKNALNDMGRKKCAEFDNAPYAVKSEDVKVEGRRQTLTLTFTCKPVLKSSAYTSSYADSSTVQTISYTAPINLSPEEQEMVNKNKTLLQVQQQPK